METYRINAIDPGLTSGGLVALEGPRERVLAARDFSKKIPAPRDVLGNKTFTAAVDHAFAQARRVEEMMDELDAEFGRPAVYAVEAFTDQPSKARKAPLLRDRWKTPLFIGALVPVLEKRGYSTSDGTLVFQDPAILGQFASELGQLAQRRKGDRTEVVCPGDHLLTSDHVQKAWAHGSWLNQRHGRNT